MQLNRCQWPRCLVLGAALLLAGVPTASPETVLVLLDNSGSIRHLSRTYQDDILAAMEAAPDHLYFVPLGDVQEGPLQVVDGSLDPGQRSRRVKAVFRFSDLFTKVDHTLRRVEESSVFEEAHAVILVSDLAPDHDNAGSWRFNEADLKDLDLSLRRLERWTESKPLTLVLHGWVNLPVAVPDDTLTAFRSELAAAIQRAAATGLNYSGNGRALVGRGVALLARERGDRVRLLAISPLVEGLPNEEELGEVFCATLRITDQDYCSVGKDKTPIDVRVDVDPALLLREQQIAMIQKSCSGQVYIGTPREVRVSVARSASTDGRDPSSDLHFRVLRSATGDPKHFPRVRATVKTLQGEVVELDEVTSTDRQVDTDQVATWAADSVASQIRAAAAEYYPPVRKLKKIFLRDPQGKAVGEGYRVRVTTYQSQGEPDRSKARVTNEDGAVRIPLPTAYERAEVQLLVGDGSIVVETLEPRAVRARQDLQIAVPDGLFRECRFERAGQGVQAEMSIFLEGGERDYLVRKLGWDGRPISVSLLPGTYRCEVTPVDARNVLASASTSLGPTFVISSQASTLDMTVSLLPDPLAEPSDWERQVGAFLAEGRLLPGAADLVRNSANVVAALLRYSSNRLDGGGSPEDLRPMWGEVRRVAFDPQRQTQMQRRLARAMAGVGLDPAEPSAFLFLRAAFNIMVDGRDPWLAADSAQVLEQRRAYNAWLERVTGHGGLMGRQLSDLLRAR